MAIGEASGTNVDSINGLNGGNPLHMNPNNSTSTSLIPFKLTGPKNYRIWASAMKLAFQARNKYAFVDGSCVKSAYASSNVLSTQWDRCKVDVLTWIMNSVSTDAYIGLVYFVNAATVWKDLESTYDKFDALTKLPTCDCDANKKLETHNKLMKLMQFLMGLDECYMSVRSSLLTRDPLPKVKDAYVIVSREESHRGIPESSSVIETKLNATSFAAKSSNNFKRSNNNDVKTNDKQQSAGSQKISSSFTPEQMKKLLSLINETSSGSVRANMAGRASFFNANVWFNINFSKYFYGNNNMYVKTITLGWIIDSGVNQHLTISTVGMFNIVDISNLKITVGHPNGTLATMSHVGNLKLTKNVILYDVLVVPGYCVSLLSVNKMIKDSKLFVSFDEEKCYIQDLKKEIILGTGSESGGLYLFDLQSDKNIANINMIHAFNVSKSLWHSRLGHPVDQVLVVLKDELKLSKNPNVSACEVYHRAKL
ncbi:ribonuclease H-like domain-containing protein [Tanacetum coccineum]